MAIQFPCVACGQTLSVPLAAAGKNAKCPLCGSISSAPAAAQQTAAAATAPQRPASPTTAAANSTANTADALPPTRVLQPGDPTGLGGLLQELTQDDLLTKAERLAMEEKSDPLAPYLTNWRYHRDLLPVGPRPIAIWILGLLVGLLGLWRLYLVGRAAYTLYQASGLNAFNTLNPATEALILMTVLSLAIILLAAALLSQSSEGWWIAQIMISSQMTGWVLVIYRAAQAAEPMQLLAEGVLIVLIMLGIATLAYLNYRPVRENFRIHRPAWLGPLVSIPLGIACFVGLRLGTPYLFEYLR